MLRLDAISIIFRPTWLKDKTQWHRDIFRRLITEKFPQEKLSKKLYSNYVQFFEQYIQKITRMSRTTKVWLGWLDLG